MFPKLTGEIPRGKSSRVSQASAEAFFLCNTRNENYYLEIEIFPGISHYLESLLTFRRRMRGRTKRQWRWNAGRQVKRDRWCRWRGEIERESCRLQGGVQRVTTWPDMASIPRIEHQTVVSTPSSWMWELLFCFFFQGSLGRKYSISLNGKIVEMKKRQNDFLHAFQRRLRVACVVF